MEEKSEIYLQNYSIKFDKVILNDINIVLHGPLSSVIGENGSGKTTLLNALYKKYSKDISYFQQDFQLFENLTGLENIKLVSSKIDTNLLDTLQIKEIISKKVKQLSSGEKQRIICYLSLKINNKWVFLDEIDNHIDAKRARAYYSLLQRANNNYLFISHNKVFVDNYANETFLLENGKLIKEKSLNKETKHNTKDNHKSLISLFLLRCHGLRNVFISLILFILAILFSNISFKEVENKYFNNPINLQVESMIYKDDIMLEANYSSLKIFDNFSDYLEFYNIDLFSFLDYEEGLYINQNKIEYPLLSNLYQELNFDNQSKNLQIYISDKIEETNVHFKIEGRQIKSENSNYYLDNVINVEILGKADIPVDSFIYDYHQLEYILNNSFNNLNLIDNTKNDHALFKSLYGNRARFVSVLNKPIPYEKIGLPLKYQEYSLFNISNNLLDFKYEYHNYVINRVVIRTINLVLLSSLLIFGIYSNLNFRNKYFKKFDSFYKVIGTKIIDKFVFIIVEILPFILFLISMLIYIL